MKILLDGENCTNIVKSLMQATEKKLLVLGRQSVFKGLHKEFEFVWAEMIYIYIFDRCVVNVYNHGEPKAQNFMRTMHEDILLFSYDEEPNLQCMILVSSYQRQSNRLLQQSDLRRC